MDTRIAIWNVLHDGDITAISEDGHVLTMVVSIPYLRRRLEPSGDSFVLTLAGVRQAEFRGFDRATSSLPEELDRSTREGDMLEILTTESESLPVTIEMTNGYMILDFDSIHLALDTGQPVDYATIEKVCVEYWTELRTKAEQRWRGRSA